MAKRLGRELLEGVHLCDECLWATGAVAGVLVHAFVPTRPSAAKGYNEQQLLGVWLEEPLVVGAAAAVQDRHARQVMALTCVSSQASKRAT